MEIEWRCDEYEFEPKILEGGGDNWSRYSNVNGLIFGADTESVQLEDRYEPQCFTCSDPWGGDFLEYIPEQDHGLRYFLKWFLDKYFFTLVDSGSHHFLYFHNLEYDWLQLIKQDETLLELARIGVSPGEDMDLFRFDGYRIKLKKNALFAGSAPHVKLRISKGSKKQEKAFTLYLYDTFSFFPSSLSKLAKDLKLNLEKMERQEDLGQVDFRAIPDENEEKQYFEKYAKIDSRVTQMAGEKIRELHQHAGMTKIRASSPAYAISWLFHMMKPDQKIRTGVNDENVMQLIFDTYRGGRTGGIVHGKVENISVLDFHSSYPASMLSLPSFSPDMQYIRLEGEELEIENVRDILKETGNAFLRISGTETDPYYPTLLTTFNGKLTPIYGDFQNIATTGYEFMVGLESGSLTNVVIHECVVLLDVEEEPFLPFKVFAETAYIDKNNSKKGTVEYTAAKLKLNSAYGKLIESRTQTLIGSARARDYLPFIDGMEKEFGNYYYTEYVKMMEEGEAYESWYERMIEEVTGNFEEETVEAMQQKMFGDFSISGRIYGRYVIPAAASLITGCSRARLCVAMKTLKAIYWDTDSVFVENLPDSKEEVNLLLYENLFWLPGNAVPVLMGDALGELDREMKNGHGFLAGTKRYYLTDDIWDQEVYDEDGKRMGVQKRATHGIPALPHEKIPEVIASLATGKNYGYTSKARPLKAKESKSANDVGSFRAGNYNSQFHLDERLQWEKTPNGWKGTIRAFTEQVVKEMSEEEYAVYLEKLYQSDLSYDGIKEAIKEEGFLKVVTRSDVHYYEYRALPAHVKRIYFRRNGVPIDVWCTQREIEIEKLFEELKNK